MRADIPLGVDAKAAFLMSLLLSNIESVSVGVAGSHTRTRVATKYYSTDRQ